MDAGSSEAHNLLAIALTHPWEMAARFSTLISPLCTVSLFTG